jgi:hypothetical protein
MSFVSAVAGILGGGTGKAIENIASEWIETAGETAEAAALMVKTLDPNGLMRRRLSARVTDLYTAYIVIALLLMVAQSFGFGDAVEVAAATKNITELFVPITTMFSLVLSASFGVNYANVRKEK